MKRESILRYLKPKLWNEYWSKEKHPAVSKIMETVKRGKPVISKMCMAHFSEAMGNHYREGIKVLDYGCGNGRYANFLFRRLDSFEYWGIEPSRYQRHFKDCWRTFSRLQNIHFGVIDGKVESFAIKSANVILLLSVLTHLPHEAFKQLLIKFKPVFARGGVMVFSTYTAAESSLGREKPPGFSGLESITGYYCEVFWQPDAMQQVIKEVNSDWSQKIRCVHVGLWDGGRIPHQIFRIEPVS